LNAWKRTWSCHFPAIFRFDGATPKGLKPWHAGFGVTVLYYGAVVPFVVAWLVGGAAVSLLWRPASTAFFKPQGWGVPDGRQAAD
jgi:hypothetical protein